MHIRRICRAATIIFAAGSWNEACLVVTPGPDVLPRGGVNRLRPADGHVPAWLQHVPPEPGRDQRKRIDPYLLTHIRPGQVFIGVLSSYSDFSLPLASVSA
jgi:hypothetical protein